MARFLRRISRRLWRMDPCHFDFYCRFEVIRMNPLYWRMKYFIFGALCPSKSGLMNKHIVKHIMMMAGLGILLWVWLIFELDD